MDGAMDIPAPISLSFCVPYWTQFEVKKKSAWNAVEYTAKDGEGNLRFTMTREGGFFSKVRRTMIDVASGNTLLSLFYSARKGGWKVYLGDSKTDSDLLFSFKKKAGFWKPAVHEALLAGNDDSSNPDFSLQKKSKSTKGFTILSHGRIMAEAERVGCGMAYSVKVYPGVDQAFIAILTILWMVDVARKAAARATAIAASA